MSKNRRIVLVTLIIAGIFLVLTFVYRDLSLKSGKTIKCGDGPRETIDIRSFTTDYWTYSFEFEAKIKDRGNISAKITPIQLKEISEAQQQANEFRKYVVAGYNSCAISKAQYAELGTRFQVLDNLSRQIIALLQKPVLSPDQKNSITSLIKDYSRTVITLGEASRR